MLELAERDEHEPATPHDAELVANVIVEEVDPDAERSCGFLREAERQPGGSAVLGFPPSA